MQRLMQLLRSPRVRWAAGLLGLGYLGARLAVLFCVDFRPLHAWANGLDGGGLVMAMSALPLVFFPTGVLHMLAGAKFGVALAFPVTGLAILINLLGAHWLANRVFREPLMALVSRTKYQVPQVPAGQHATLALVAAFLPGPFALKNYLLALAGIRLRPFLAVSLPIHIFRSSSGILFGGFSGQLSTGRILFLVAYGTIVTLIIAHLVKRFRRSAGQFALAAPR